MYSNRALTIAVLAVAVAFASSVALAAPALLSTDYRYASQTDKTITSGGGTVSASKTLPQGLRLATPGTSDEMGKAVATAVYLFKVPLAATSFTIETGYRADAQAKQGDIAGYLLVRTSKAVAEGPIEPENRPTPPKRDEQKPSGDIYFLKGNETTASITVPAQNRIVDGVLEVRLTAESGQAFDAQYVQVASHRSVGGYTNTEGYQKPDVPSGRAYDPLNSQQQPPQFYGYGVPNLYPNLYGAGHANSQDPIFWNQVWQMQRPHLYIYPYPVPYHDGHGHKPHKK
jgi:hypothetical protein